LVDEMKMENYRTSLPKKEEFNTLPSLVTMRIKH
jgi:hypothetical protein